MSQFRHPINEEKSYRRALFAFAALALAGCCSIYPVMCFKNYSSKEKERLNRKVAKVERKAEEGEDSLTGSSSSSAALLCPSRSPPPQGETRGRRIGDGVGVRQVPTLQLSRIRPAVGSGSPPSPPRSPTSEAVPSQLVGGRVGSDADILSQQAQEPVIHPKTYHSARRESAVARLRNLLSPPKIHRPPLLSMPEGESRDPASSATTPPSTGSSGGSKSTTASGVSASGDSSFPYLLQAKRSDTRLLHKKSQPLAFRRKQTPLSRHKPTEVRRTPSFYKPKVVEDSAVVDHASSPALMRPKMPPTSSTLTVTELIKLVETPKPARPLSASPRSVSPVGQLKRLTSAPGLASKERRSPDRFSDRPTPPLFKRRTSFKTPTLKSSSEPSMSTPIVRNSSPGKSPQTSPERPPTRKSRHQFSLHLPPRSPGSPPERHYHNVTPPEKDPSSPYRAHFNHGDHYFRTFGPEIDHIPTPAPTSDSLAAPERPAEEAPQPCASPGVVRFQTPKRPSKDESSAAIKPSRSSIFNVFRKSLFIDSIARPSTSTPKTPGIEVTPPIEHVAKRRHSTRASDIVTPPYFAQSPSRSTPSTTTPLSPLSPRSRLGDSPAASLRLLHRRMSSQKSSSDTSEPSPFTCPRQRPRLRHNITLENIAEPYLPFLSSKRAETQASPHQQLDRPATTYKSAEGEEMYHTAASPDAVHWMLPGNATLTAPRVKGSRESFKKPASVFKRLRWDTDSSPISRRRSATKSEGPRSSRVHKPAMQHSASMGSLLRKAPRSSIMRLKKTASQSTVRSHGTVIERPELEVTNFHQTPYAQRVANNRRNEMNLLRSYIEEALNDEDDNTVFGFELNVPDHLPNSPLCPLNPKHKSGGKAICPLHGRRKKKASTVATKPSQKPATRSPQRTTAEPQIVYESKVGEGSRKFSARSVPEGSALMARVMSPTASEGPWYKD